MNYQSSLHSAQGVDQSTGLVAGPPHKTQKRQTLEIIVDTCSSGRAQFEAVDELIAHAHRAQMPDGTPLYDAIRIVIPMQIGTEFDRQFFPEFLRQALMRPLTEAELGKEGRMRLRSFYQKYIPLIDIVETDVSCAYKMTYAKFAAQLMRSGGSADIPGATRRTAVYKRACELFSHYGGDAPMPSKRQFVHFCDKLYSALGDQQVAEGQTRRRIRRYHYSRDPHIPAEAKEHCDRAGEVTMARHSERFLNELSRSERIFLQAMYSEPALNREISGMSSFKQYRLDKGERAIESYACHARDGYDPGVVTVVLSEDKGARESINRLRESSKNSLLVVSRGGLNTALQYLRAQEIPIPMLGRNEPSPLDARGRWRVNPSHIRAEKLQEGKIMFAKHRESKLNAIDEGEAARRLAEIIMFGCYEKRARAPYLKRDIVGLVGAHYHLNDPEVRSHFRDRLRFEQLSQRFDKAKELGRG